MISTGCGNGWLINWDNSSIGEGLETGISGSINSWSSIGIDSSINSLGGKVVSTGSGNSWLINWDNSSIWVSNKLGVKVEGTSITIGGNWGSNWGNWGSNWSSCVSNLGNWGSNLSNNWGSRGISLSLGNKVISTGSSNSWLINRDNSSIGESLEAIKTLCRGCGNTGGENLKFLLMRFSILYNIFSFYYQKLHY